MCFISIGLCFERLSWWMGIGLGSGLCFDPAQIIGGIVEVCGAYLCYYILYIILLYLIHTLHYILISSPISSPPLLIYLLSHLSPPPLPNIHSILVGTYIYLFIFQTLLPKYSQSPF